MGSRAKAVVGGGDGTVFMTSGRRTVSKTTNRLSISFVGGNCTGRTGLVIDGKSTIIGRGEDCDIILDGETVSRRHCTITQWGGIYVVQDSSRNGTFVNDERISEVTLADNDQLRVGQNLMVINIFPGNATSALHSQETTPLGSGFVFELRPHIVVKGLEDATTQPFSEERITIGRRTENHLVLDAENISREHAAIERRDGGYYIMDLGSANGTYHNNQRVDVAQLQHGDRVRIGSYVLQITMRDQDCIVSFVPGTPAT
ncbi:MAG: FHA domain-containing protein [Acidobacteria bacterium]|nr:FHA domain-containing protein [Acidobacteriota bacterium]MCW5967227.1 FHA domain-containing protein [Blastocatellales bacterium]